jgi:hypothetical protein
VADIAKEAEDQRVAEALNVENMRLEAVAEQIADEKLRIAVEKRRAAEDKAAIANAAEEQRLAAAQDVENKRIAVAEEIHRVQEEERINAMKPGAVIDQCSVEYEYVMRGKDDVYESVLRGEAKVEGSTFKVMVQDLNDLIRRVKDIDVGENEDLAGRRDMAVGSISIELSNLKTARHRFEGDTYRRITELMNELKKIVDLPNLKQLGGNGEIVSLRTLGLAEVKRLQSMI